MAFLTPDPNDKNDWPDIIRIPNEGRLNVAYANGKSESFKMMGMLIRPKLFIRT